MNQIHITELPAHGAPCGGGFYVGRLRVGTNQFALIVAPKAEGSFTGEWNGNIGSVSGAGSYCDGLENTKAMAEAGSAIAISALSLHIAGHADWYLPSRDELELMYRHLKPSSQENAESFRDGDNPSSVPTGYPYTGTMPAQTLADVFQGNGAEAFDRDWHWSSTQTAATPAYAWIQGFSSGGQGYGRKGHSCRARAVRRLLIIE